VIALSFALPEESRDLARHVEGARRSGPAALPVIAGKLRGREVALVHSGMGMKSAGERVGSFLDAHAPGALIAAGFGGGLAAGLKVGDMVVAQNFSDAGLLEATAKLPGERGNLITTREAIESALQKKDLARHTGAIVVDMETAAIYRLCEARKIPMLAARAISDTVDEDLPVPMEIWFDMARQRPRAMRLILHLAGHPEKIERFAKFVRGVGRARRTLTDFLLAAIEVLPER